MGKKSITILMCLVLMHGTGCSSEKNEVDSEPEIIIGISKETEKADELIKLPIILGSNFTAVSNDEYKDTWLEFIKDKFMIDLEIIDDYNRFIYYDGAYMKSALIFDKIKGLAYMPSTAVNTLYALVETGDILPLKAILEKNEAWNSLPADMRKMFELDGEIWGIPTESTYAVYTRFVNKDWLEKVGLEKPANIDELYQVCKAFAYEDPDGDDKANTIGAWLYAPSVIDIFNVYDCRLQFVNNGMQVASIAYNSDSGQFEDCMGNPGMKEALEYLQSMVSEGISTNAGDKPFGTYAAFQEGFSHDLGRTVQNWEGWLDSSREYNEGIVKKYTGYEYIFSLNNKATNPVFYNYSGGFYVADNHMVNPEDSINRFINVFFGNREAYYTGMMGLDYNDSTYVHNNLALNRVPPVIGRIPVLYDEKYDDISKMFGNTVETARRDLLVQLEAFAESHYSYSLYPKTGYGVYEKGGYNTFQKYGTSQMVKGDPLLGLFESLYYQVIHSYISIEEGFSEYASESKKMGIKDYLEELNEKIGRFN